MPTIPFLISITTASINRSQSVHQSTIATSIIPCLRFLMAAAATKKNQQTAPAATPVVDPKFEWTEKAGSYVLRLPLPGFRKDDFRVQVDGAGKLTVRGARPAAAGQSSLYKVFQLPSTASLDDIAGRFEAGVLTLTVPKRASSDGVGAGAAQTSIEEIKRKQPGVAKEEGAKPLPPAKDLDEKKAAAGVAKPKEEIANENALKKPMDEATKKAPQQKQPEEEAKSSKQEQQKPAPVTAKNEENVKPKAPQAAAAAAPQKPETKPEVATSGADKAKAAVAPESLADKVRRRSEEESANAPPMTAAKRAKTDGEKKATAACSGWYERVQGELKVLTDMKWADGMVEAARKNKEVVAVGIAAFSLGFIVSHKLFKK